MKNILFFLLASFLCIQCKNECVDENIKLGNVSFDQKTLDHIDVYEGIENVSFKSSTGDIKTYTINKEESSNPILCVKVTCRPSYELEGENGCEYYDAEDRHYTLSSDDITLHAKAGMEIAEPDTENYYEYVELGFNNGVDSVSAGTITAANYIDPSFIQTSILNNRLDPSTIYVNNYFRRILLYSDDNAEITIGYLKGKGINYYKIDNVEWILVE